MPHGTESRSVGAADAPASDAVRRVASLEYGRVLASVIGTVNDWTIAEDAVQDALARALDRWPRDGVPRSPAAWVTTVARRRAIDLVRHESAERRALARLEHELPEVFDEVASGVAFPRGDERLQLIFTACHPALTLEARAALTLRTVLNVPVDELAILFAVSPETMQKRLVRARAKIKHAGIAYRVPGPAEMSARSESVCEVLSGLFTLAYADPTARSEAAAEAIRLARLCCELFPSDSAAWLELNGVLALLLLQHSRRAARTSAEGLTVPFERQDRELWDQEAADEGLRILDAALERAAQARVPGGRHLVRAAIAAEYVRPFRVGGPGEIDHARIAGMYELLERLDPSPFVTVNRVIAVANAGHPAAALELLETVALALAGHHLLAAVRGDMLRRLDRTGEAAAALRTAAAAAPSDRERQSYLHEAALLDLDAAHAHP
ncbi:sigma-70 family RNA polymerase sigma factor [Agrococcus sp. 1P02AA]|uniref:RNA polymerase sigma factor n=1 Tax=Agrococcus sp. 1P02AA TaxID=3132259 RepID=UPI0039A55969